MLESQRARNMAKRIRLVTYSLTVHSAEGGETFPGDDVGFSFGVGVNGKGFEFVTFYHPFNCSLRDI